MSAYEKLNDTTTVEKNILREVFLDRIWELEDQIQNATKLTKVKDLEMDVDRPRKYDFADFNDIPKYNFEDI